MINKDAVWMSVIFATLIVLVLTFTFSRSTTNDTGCEGVQAEIGCNYYKEFGFPFTARTETKTIGISGLETKSSYNALGLVINFIIFYTPIFLLINMRLKNNENSRN